MMTTFAVIGALFVIVVVAAFILMDVHVTVEYSDEREECAPPPYQIDLPAIRRGHVFYNDYGVPYCRALRDLYDVPTGYDFEFYGRSMPRVIGEIESRELRTLLEQWPVRGESRA